MNITKHISVTALWIVTACTLATIAGCTAGGPNSVEGTMRVSNAGSSNVRVSQNSDVHPLAPNATIDLPINSFGLTVMPEDSNRDKIDRFNLKFNPGGCSVNLCVVVY